MVWYDGRLQIDITGRPRVVVTDRAQPKAACVAQNTDYCCVNGAHRIVLRNYPDVRRRDASACYLRSSRANGPREQFIFDRSPRCISPRQRGDGVIYRQLYG